jgi:hypothetical protein
MSTSFHLLGIDVHGLITNVYGTESSDQKANILDFLDWYKQEKPRKMSIIGGDFNLITTLKEKKVEHFILALEYLRFKDFIDNNELVDLETTNEIYTWNNQRGGSSQITSLLDKFLVSEEIATSRQELVATILPSAGSDNWPICMQWNHHGNTHYRPFKFEKFWLTHPNFIPMIKDWWFTTHTTRSSKMYRFQQKLKMLKQHLRVWKKSTFSNIFSAKIRLELEMETL